MSSSLLETHLKEINKIINPSKEKVSKKARHVAKTPKGLPQPSIKVGRKRKLTSYIDGASKALERGQERLDRIVELAEKQLRKKKKTKADAIRIIKIHKKRV